MGGPPRAGRPLLPSIASSRFEILEEIGSGAFGVVYLARDRESGELVALKTIAVQRGDHIYRLKHEFRALENLRHPNLIRFYELFADEDQVCFTMEYVPGTNFLGYVRPTGALDEHRLHNALAQLVEGLCVLHARRQLHRDVKPSNVLVTTDDRVVLLDFGLATGLEPSALGRSIDLAGTPEYMSPEQALGKTVSTASDWYSVGVMLYQALTGRVPFRGTWSEIIDLQQRWDPVSPHALAPEAPADLSDICLSLIARDPRDRAGGEEIRAVLGQAPARPEAQADALGDKVLVGRQRELDELNEALARVRDGEGVTVFLDGASGVGKTSLVERFLGQAERHSGAIVLRGRCYERERVPYQGIDSLIGDLRRLLNGLDRVSTEILPRHVAALVRLFPELESVPAIRGHCQRSRPKLSKEDDDDQEVRRHAFGALRELLAALADRRLLVLHIDDLQWGDLDTAKLLREVLRPPDAPEMLLVLAFRSEDRDRSPCLQALGGETIGARVDLHLGPLDANDAGTLMRALLPAAMPESDVASLTRGTDGNPFLIQELARAVADPHSRWTPDASPDVRQALRTRFARLPAAARSLLETVAVAGHPVTELVARRACGLSGSPWEDSRRLDEEHLVRFSGSADERRLEPFHDRIREAVLADLSAERASECHRGLAEALEEAGSVDPEVLAQHHEAAGNPEQALHFSVLAAEQADRALAFDRAVRLYERAIGLAPAGNPQRVELLAALGGALANSGRCADAADRFLQAAEGETAAAERTRLRRRAAEQRFFAGQIDQGRKLIRADLKAQGFPVPGRRIAYPSLLLHRTKLRLRGLEPRKCDSFALGEVKLLEHVYNVCVGISFVDALIGGEMAVRYFLRALDLGEPHLIARGRALIAGHAAIEAPRSEGTRKLIQRMEEDGKKVAERAVDGDMACVRGLKAYFGGDWREALGHLDTAERIFSEDCPGLVWELWTTRAVAVWALFFRGQWREMQRRVEAGLREASDRGNLYAKAGIVSPFGVSAWLARDDVAGARESLREVTSGWVVRGFQFQKFWFLTAESLIRLYAGDGRGAWEELSRGWDDVANPAVTFRFPMLTVQLLNVRGGCALAAAALEEPGSRARQDLLRQAERAARRLRKVNVPQASGLADLLRGSAAAQRQQTAEAVTFIERAVRDLDRLEMDAFAAAARCRLAQLKGVSAPGFLPDEAVANPEAMIRMLAPGFPDDPAVQRLVS